MQQVTREPRGSAVPRPSISSFARAYALSSWRMLRSGKQSSYVSPLHHIRLVAMSRQLALSTKVSVKGARCRCV